MCIKPDFYTTTICKDCGHRVNTYHSSDVLRLSRQCGKCDSQNLEYQHHDYQFQKVTKFFKKFFGGKLY